MPINYDIKSEVIDIKTDTPNSKDFFLVDTNVWYWLTYTRASQATQRPSPYQLTTYTTYIKKALSSKSKLFTCGLSLPELAHLIEKTEYEIHIRSHQGINKKEYRYNYPSCRNGVVQEISAAWAQVAAMSEPLKVLINEPVTNCALKRLKTEFTDGYDVFILEAIKQCKILQVITDDGDYSSVSGIKLFTAKPEILRVAQQQGKLVGRLNQPPRVSATEKIRHLIGI